MNQYLYSQELSGVDFPVNAFVCGQTGFLYYSQGEKSNIYKGVYDGLVSTLEELTVYNFSFNSLPSGLFNILKSSKKGKSNLYLKVPYHSALTTEDGINIREYALFDLIIPGDVFTLEKDYFVLHLDSANKIKKFKYLRSSGKLDGRINFTLNAILYFIELEKAYDLEMKQWTDFWVDGVDLVDFKKIENYDGVLTGLSGKKINYL